MSLFSAIEKTIERGFRAATERMFGPADTDELLLVHRAILEHVESRVQIAQRGRRIFPYSRLVVRLASPEPERRAIYEAAFARDRRLEHDLRDALTGAGCDLPAGFAVDVETLEDGLRPFAIEYATAAAPATPPPEVAAPQAPARLTTVRGKTRTEAFTIERRRINIGRLDELTDPDHRVIRRNDIIFEEGGDDANATVSRAHAHVRFEAGQYRIADDGSEYGTRIFRDGRSIEVPTGIRRGERLKSGDEVYLGRACLRFEWE